MLNTKTSLRQETIDGLQDLIQINLDSVEGFQTASKHIDDTNVKSLFTQLASERQQFAQTLQKYVEANDEKPRDSGSAKGMLHRWWIDIKGAVGADSLHSILAEAERGEDEIKETYETVIKDTTGNPVNDVLHDQYARVKAGHDRIRDLRDATA